MKTSAGLLSLAIVGCGLLASLPAKADAYFTDGDRALLRDYVTTTRTDNGRMTTTTTYYKPGAVLPDTVTYETLPPDVTVKLLPPPPGDEYVVVGRNAYLINPDKRVVIDSMRLGGGD